MQTASTSVFDPNVFMETNYKGNLDTTYVLPDEGDYIAQASDVKITSGLIGKGDRTGQPWANCSITWELTGPAADEYKTKFKIDKCTARQGVMLDLLVENGRVIGPDLGQNKNMRLKRVLDATGLNTSKQWNLAMLKFQTAFVTVKHVRPEGFDDNVAEVTRVVSLSKATANGAA